MDEGLGVSASSICSWGPRALGALEKSKNSERTLFSNGSYGYTNLYYPGHRTRNTPKNKKF